jgi:hypothetical protein
MKSFKQKRFLTQERKLRKKSDPNPGKKFPNLGKTQNSEIMLTLLSRTIANSNWIRIPNPEQTISDSDLNPNLHCTKKKRRKWNEEEHRSKRLQHLCFYFWVFLFWFSCCWIFIFLGFVGVWSFWCLLVFLSGV